MTGLRRHDGWRVNHTRVEWLWRQEGLTMPKPEPPRRRLWLTDGSGIRLQAEHPNHVGGYDFMAPRTKDGRPVKRRTIGAEYTRECVAIDVARRRRSDDVLSCRAELVVHRGGPQHIRSDNGPEVAAKAGRSWLSRAGVQTRFITQAVPERTALASAFMGHYGMHG